MEIELVDVRSGERQRTFDPVAGPADSVEALTARVAVQATAGAVAHLAPDSPPWASEWSLPVSLEAYEHYLSQQDHFCSLRYDDALVEGDRTLALSPDYIPALWQNAIIYNNQGRQEEADSTIAVLSDLRERMTTAERLNYDWFVANRLGEPAVSTRAAEELYRLDPSGSGGAAMLTAWRTGRMNDAVERYYALDRPGGCRWTGTWTQGSVAFHALGRFEEELEVAREGLRYWPGRRGFMGIETRAFAGMGRPDAVDSVLRAMEVLPPATDSDDLLTAAYAAAELRVHGHEAEASALFETTLDRFRSRAPDDRPYNTGRALYQAGEWAEAASIFEPLVEASPENPSYLRYYGVAVAKLGQREQALEIAERASALTRSGLRGRHLLAHAVIMDALGDSEEAVRYFQTAFDNGAMRAVWLHRDPALDDIRGYPPFDALMRPR
jgi:tetratricopeptide (TPR) repeat protein